MNRKRKAFLTNKRPFLLLTKHNFYYFKKWIILKETRNLFKPNLERIEH